MTMPFLLIMAMFTLNPVTLSVWPGYAQMRPATFTFVMLTAKHEGNREACMEVDGPEFKSFCWQMDGASARRSWRFEWTFRGGGNYVATATVRRTVDGQTRYYTDSHPFRVIGME